MSLVTWQDLCIDALDVDAQARFWAAVSGLEVADAEPPARLAGPTGKHTLWVNPVDRPHRTKNRTHLDIDCASVAELVVLGARVLAPSEETGFGPTACTGTSSDASTSCSPEAPPTCGTSRGGPCWPTPRATSSASSLPD